ncbi:glycosyltransferase family 39 protein [bacterium]|nr:glycosyltransferase family 39 protein [bacterium]
MTSETNNLRFSLIAGGGLFLLAFVLRYIGLFRLDVWFDEIAVLLQTDLSLAEIWRFNQNENFPPLFPWIVKLWSYIASSDSSYRLLAALIGALLPPISYFLGREIQDRKLGVLLGICCAISLPLLYYSQVVRMYGLFVVASTISYLFFLRAIKTEKPSYWFITALANLAAFYAFLFGLFIIITEFLILAWIYRSNLKKILPPLIAHIPTFILMSFWFAVLIDRSNVAQSYLASQNLYGDFIRMWMFLGSGSVFYNNLGIALVINLPLIIGFILSFRTLKKEKTTVATITLLVLPIFFVSMVSVIKVPVLDGRYMLFLTPLYLVLGLRGWILLKNSTWRKIGIIAVFASLSISSGYYYSHFLSANDDFRHHGVFKHTEDDDGNCYSRMADTLQERLQPDEIIIHFGGPFLRSFTFFTSIYFHHRTFPEYLFTADDVSYCVGRQYIQPGEQISTLNSLDQIPHGIWVVTLNDPKIIYKSDEQDTVPLSKLDKWLETGNLPEELSRYNYHFEEIIRDGSLSALYFTRTKPVLNDH